MPFAKPNRRSPLRTLMEGAAGLALGLGLAAALLGAPKAWAHEASVAPAVQAAPAAAAGPAMWVIRDADSTIYLFGTIHMLKPDVQWLTPRVQAAFDASDELWLEVADPEDQAAAVPLIQQYGLSLDTPLSQRLGAEDFARLDTAARAMGMSGAQLEPLRPWLASITLGMAPLLKAGYQPGTGADVTLRAQALAASKPVRELETLAGQISMLAGASEETQLAMLRETLHAFDEAEIQIDGLVAAWASGDVAGIERISVTEMKEQSAELYDIMLTRRNADWVGQIRTLLAGSGTAFIAVGAAHLAGPDSVVAMLEQSGVDVDVAP